MGAVGGAGLEDTQQGHRHFQAAFQTHGHKRIRPGAKRAQMARQLVGLLVECGIT